MDKEHRTARFTEFCKDGENDQVGKVKTKISGLNQGWWCFSSNQEKE